IGVEGTGFGAALGWNSVFDTVKARIENSSLTGVTGSVTVTAESTENDGLFDGKISAAAIGAAGSSEGNAIAGALAINGIVNTIDAHVSLDSQITANGDVTIEALDTSSIKSLTGGAALSLGGTGFGVGLSVNFIANTVTAKIDSSNVDTSQGTGSVT